LPLGRTPERRIVNMDLIEESWRPGYTLDWFQDDGFTLDGRIGSAGSVSQNLFLRSDSLVKWRDAILPSPKGGGWVSDPKLSHPSRDRLAAFASDPSDALGAGEACSMKETG
jgi:hypothetical protein